MLEVHMLQANCQQCYVCYVNALDLDQPQECIKSDNRLHINYAALPRVRSDFSEIHTMHILKMPWVRRGPSVITHAPYFSTYLVT